MKKLNLRKKKHNKKEIFSGAVFMALALVSIHCKPIAPSVGKDRFFGNRSSDSLFRPKGGLSAPISQTALKLRIFEDEALFDSEVRKHADDDQLALSDQDLAAQFAELKGQKKTKLPLDGFVSGEVLVLAKLKLRGSELPLSAEKERFLSSFDLEIRPVSDSTWQLAVAESTDPDASAWVRSHLSKLIVVYGSAAN